MSIIRTCCVGSLLALSISPPALAQNPWGADEYTPTQRAPQQLTPGQLRRTEEGDYCVAEKMVLHHHRVRPLRNALTGSSLLPTATSPACYGKAKPPSFLPDWAARTAWVAFLLSVGVGPTTTHRGGVRGPWFCCRPLLASIPRSSLGERRGVQKVQ